MSECEGGSGERGRLLEVGGGWGLGQMRERVNKWRPSPKMKTIASGPIISWQINGVTMETVTDSFLELQNHCGW